MGNPDPPGITSAGGQNWVGYMVTEFNTAVTLSYNFARSGATVDASLIDPPEEDLVQQVQQFLDHYGTQALPKGRTRYNTVAGIWIGVNDVNRTYNRKGGVSELYPAIMKQYFKQLQRLYDVKTRKFILIAVPRKPAV
jgi:hypothetical protein